MLSKHVRSHVPCLPNLGDFPGHGPRAPDVIRIHYVCHINLHARRRSTLQVITYDLGLDTGVFGARSGRTYAPHTALFAPLTPPTTIQHVPIKKVQIYATHVCTHAHTSARTASSGARRKSTATSAIANRVLGGPKDHWRSRISSRPKSEFRPGFSFRNRWAEQRLPWLSDPWPPVSGRGSGAIQRGYGRAPRAAGGARDHPRSGGCRLTHFRPSRAKSAFLNVSASR